MDYQNTIFIVLTKMKIDINEWLSLESRANCFILAQCLHNLSRMNETCMHSKKPQKLIHMSMKMKWEFISSVSVNFHSFSLFQKHRKCRQCCNVHSLLEVLFACFLSRRHSLFSTYHPRCKYFSFCQFPPPHTSSTSSLTLHRRVFGKLLSGGSSSKRFCCSGENQWMEQIDSLILIHNNNNNKNIGNRNRMRKKQHRRGMERKSRRKAK